MRHQIQCLICYQTIHLFWCIMNDCYDQTIISLRRKGEIPWQLNFVTNKVGSRQSNDLDTLGQSNKRWYYLILNDFLVWQIIVTRPLVVCDFLIQMSVKIMVSSCFSNVFCSQCKRNIFLNFDLFENEFSFQEGSFITSNGFFL